MRDVLLLITGACLLSSATFRPPKLGYVYDPDAAEIRVISGISGAAALEETVATDSKLASAAIAPGARFALVRLRDEAGLKLLDLDSARTTNLEGAAPTGDLIAFSASAASAAVWTGERIQVWAGLPGSPSIARELAAEEVTALAVSDDGAAVAANTKNGTLLWDGGETPRALAAAAAIAFAAGSHDLLFADESGDRVSIARGTETEQLAADGIAGVASIVVASDGRTIAVANARGSSIAMVDLNTREMKLAGCECEPRELLALPGDRLFAVRAADGGVKLLDAARVEPALFTLTARGGTR